MVLRLFILPIVLLAGFTACRTTDMGMGRGEAPAALASMDVEVSEEARCELSGGEMIEGNCFCSDGTRTFEFNGKASTCAQWIKQEYQGCYAKGGTAKRNETGGHECFCPHGETIDENGSQTCYEKFAAKNPRCAASKGIILAEDRTCRCMHGGLAETIGPGGCAEDHKRRYENCHNRGGLVRDEGTCECRDGTFIHKDENASCGDKWFFHEEGLVVKPSDQNEGVNQPAKANATCRCELYNGNLVLHKPNREGKALAGYPLSQLGIAAAEVNGAKCFDVFRGKIYEAVQPAINQGGCGGSWEYVASAATGSAGKMNYSSEVDPDSMCVCKKFTGTFREPYRCGPGGRDTCYNTFKATRCGVAKPKSNDFFLTWYLSEGCDANVCQAKAGGHDLLYRNCPKYNGTPLWRTE